jgi:hypothetical protein
MRARNQDISALRIKLGGLVQIGEGVIRVALEQQQVAAHGECILVPGVEANRLEHIGEGLVILLARRVIDGAA